MMVQQEHKEWQALLSIQERQALVVLKAQQARKELRVVLPIQEHVVPKDLQDLQDTRYGQALKARKEIKA